MTQAHYMVCDQCDKQVNLGTEPDDAVGWLDVRPVVPDAGYEPRPVSEAAKGQFCSYTCLILWANSRQARGLPTLSFGPVERQGRPHMQLPERVLSRPPSADGKVVAGDPSKGKGGYL